MHVQRKRQCFLEHESHKANSSDFIFIRFFKNKSAFSKMEAQENFSERCNKIIQSDYQLKSMFLTMASHYFLGPPYSRTFNYERDSNDKH